MDIFGLAALGALPKKADLVDGKIPAEQLPSYVDDVLEFEDREHFPEEGDFGKIYVALDTGYTYRWSGSTYIQIGGQDLSGYQEKLVNQENIKSVNGESLLGSGNLAISAYHPFPNSWTTDSTTAALCQDIVADSSAVAGMIYLGKVYCSDLPASLIQGEVVVEIISNDNANGKNIHLILTSADTAPYRWEYSYVKINSSYTSAGWIGYQTQITSSSKLNADLVDDTNSTHKFTSAADITKLSGIENGAEVNAIETISIDGTAQAIDADRNVNLPAYPTKSSLGLDNVDNTSDLNKPISTATQAALDGKQATLVNQQNIKSINNNSLLGAGNLYFTVTTSGITDCPATTDGDFKLIATVSSGVVTYAWVADLSDLVATPVVEGENNNNVQDLPTRSSVEPEVVEQEESEEPVQTRDAVPQQAIPVSVTITSIPECPNTVDGQFKLRCSVVNGAIAYSWIADQSNLKATTQVIA